MDLIDRQSDTISRQLAIEAVRVMQTYKLSEGDDMLLVDQAEVMTELMIMPFAEPEDKCSECDAWNKYKNYPSAEPVRCKDCKHNPKYEWFGCPMSHLSEAQRPETAWCWKAERRTDER